jgi:trk system potassium uptake protein TrkA
VAFVTRFGRGILPTGATMLQDGDQVHLLVTDDIADAAERAAGIAPTTEGHH